MGGGESSLSLWYGTWISRQRLRKGTRGREPEREPLPEREPRGPRDEQKARYRTFNVDICKAKYVPFGLQVSTLDGFGLDEDRNKGSQPGRGVKPDEREDLP